MGVSAKRNPILTIYISEPTSPAAITKSSVKNVLYHQQQVEKRSQSQCSVSNSSHVENDESKRIKHTRYLQNIPREMVHNKNMCP